MLDRCPQTLPLLPLNRLTPRLRRSVEGLNLELEEVFVSDKPDDQVSPLPQLSGMFYVSVSCLKFYPFSDFERTDTII